MTQHNDNTGKEGLVERIRFLFYEATLSQWQEFHNSEAQTKWIEGVITLISQAIAEGKVKVAGEEGRIWARLATQDWIMDRINEGADVIIALSPAERKEGTGPLTGTGTE